MMSINCKQCLFFFTVILVGCTREKVKPISIIPAPCILSDSVNYSMQVAPILTSHCLPCHAYPGSGGINLDNYLDSKAIAQSGMLIQSIIHDTNYVIMPPPPHAPLDSCQIKVLKRWVDTGCLEH